MSLLTPFPPRAPSTDAEQETLITRARLALTEGCDANALKLYTGMLEKYGEASAAIYEGATQAFRNLGWIGPALDTVDEGLRFFPGHSSLTYIRSLLLLGSGDYYRGWPGYELRSKTRQVCYAPRRVTWRQWAGELLTGKSILLWGDQGYGDEIMFASIIPDLVNAGARITLECSRDLRSLFARSFPMVEVLAHDFNGSMPVELDGRTFDFESSLGSLARWTRNHERDFPRQQYLRSSDEVPKRFAYPQPKRVIGLSWRGGTLATRRAARSLELKQLYQLEQFRDCLFVVLQHDVTADEQFKLRNAFPQLYCNPEALKSLDTQAGLIAACDCVLTVCNTVVHLAGALGKRVNVMAPYTPEWRYGYSQQKMPWYPNVHVYRQERYGEWDSAIANAIAVSVTCASPAAPVQPE